MARKSRWLWSTWVLGALLLVATSCRYDEFLGSIDSSKAPWKTQTFDVTDPEEVELSLTWTKRAVDLNLFLIDPAGTTVAAANTTTAYPERISYTVTQKGRWTIGITAKSGGATPYKLDVLRYPPRKAPPPTGTWKLTFSDEFNGTSVDKAKWYVYDDAAGDSIESPKTTTCPKASNVSVGGGKLVMSTRKANGSCRNKQPIVGAGMNSYGKFSQAGGRWVIRARYAQKGNYQWGGLFTAGNSAGTTKENSSEIDVFEYIGKDTERNMNRFKPAIWYNYTCEGTCGVQSLEYYPHDVTQWHEYAVEWEPTNSADPTTMQIRFYVDARLITVFDKQGTWRVNADGSKTRTIVGGWGNPAGPFPNPFGLDRKHTLYLCAWVGAGGVDPVTASNAFKPVGGRADFEVDYVRVYKR